MIRTSSIAAILVTIGLAQASLAQSTVTINRDAYAEQMRGFWLGQTLANWTGRLTEGARYGTDVVNYPFFTDDDWGKPFVSQIGYVIPTINWVVKDPWPADDDTDIEYVYTHLQSGSPQPALTAEQIRAGWVAHINRKIWVSDAKARGLMDRGVLPGATSLPVSNSYGHMIDAQLTTEIYGAFAPAMPGVALGLGDLPVRTTAHGYAAHAAQYFQLLHTYIPLLTDSMTSVQKVEWLNQQARRFIPNTSKTADIIDFVTNDYMNNPDKTDWERTRDLVYQRYQVNATANGFRYQNWYESSVNFASGVIALLYGQGDYARTVKIGTLGGWDADNPTATMGGLIGMMVGEQGVRDALPGLTLSSRYLWSSTRDGLVDYLPDDSGAEDSFDLIAQRILGIVDQVVAANGGTVDLVNNQWIITLQDTTSPLLLSPTDQRMRRSANMTMKLAGKAITATSSVIGSVNLPSRFADGVEHDFTGREMASSEGQAYSTKRPSTDDVEHIFAVKYATPVTIDGVRFIEGDHFADGGWFDTISVEVLSLVDGPWAPVAATPSAALDETVPFQIIDFEFASAMEVVGIRLRGMPGGTGNYVTIAELDGLVATLMGDANGDGVVDTADYITVKQNFGMTSGALWSNGNFTVNTVGDGTVDWADLQELMANFGTRIPGTAPAAPEPGSVMLLMFGSAALLHHQGQGGQVRRRAIIGRTSR